MVGKIRGWWEKGRQVQVMMLVTLQTKVSINNSSKWQNMHLDA
jgi:hypothetical protein